MEFICVPAHVGVKRNKRVDKAANWAFEQEEVGVWVDLGVFGWQGRTRETIVERRQDEWRVETGGTHFFQLQGSVWG